MNGFAGFLGRSLRGFRLVELGALLVLLVLALGVYMAKAAAGRERANITEVQAQIDDENKRMRLLQAEVAHLEEPARLVRLSAELGLAPTNAKHEGRPEALGEIASAALIPEKGDKTSSPSGAQAGLAGHEAPTVIAQVAARTGAPQ
ncbi:MAG: cell division protein FtsL [Caulobacteraceae bacterium]